MTGKTGGFTVVPPGKGNHGPVRVHNTYHFAYADGTPYVQIGTTIYNWLDTPEELQEETLQTLAASPFNKARMLLTPQPTAYRKKFSAAAVAVRRHAAARLGFDAVQSGIFSPLRKTHRASCATWASRPI